MISHGNTGAIGHTRALPIPTKPVGYSQRTPVRTGHQPIKCGTARGYERHRELGGVPCKDCLAAVQAKPLKPAARETRTKCGTTGGYQRHIKRRETVCDECREARRVYVANLRATDERKRDYVTHPPTFDVAEAVRLREEGMKVADIAARMGKTEHTIRRHLKRAGVTVRDTPATIDVGRLRELNAQGVSGRKIAAELGCTESAVHKWTRRLGLTPQGVRGATAQPIKHGTYGGFRAEKRRGLPACDECRVAARSYERERRAS